MVCYLAQCSNPSQHQDGTLSHRMAVQVMTVDTVTSTCSGPCRHALYLYTPGDAMHPSSATSRERWSAAIVNTCKPCRALHAGCYLSFRYTSIPEMACSPRAPSKCSNDIWSTAAKSATQDAKTLQSQSQIQGLAVQASYSIRIRRRLSESCFKPARRCAHARSREPWDVTMGSGVRSLASVVV